MNYRIVIFLLSVLFGFGCQQEKADNDVDQAEANDDKISTDVIYNPNTADDNAVVDEDDLPEMTFPETEYDFGHIKQGAIVNHVFMVRNTGKRDLVISDVKASCGCTVPGFSKTPIPPGEEGEIEVKYDTKDKQGYKRISITVTANTIPNSKTIYIVADVLPIN